MLSPKFVLVAAFVLFVGLESASGEKFLFFVGLASHSHRVAVQPLADALAERGHEVTFFSAIKPAVKNPKIKEVCTKSLWEFNEKMQNEVSGNQAMTRFEFRDDDPIWKGTYIFDLMYGQVESMVTDPEFLEFINATRYDAIVFDAMAKEFLYPIAHKTKAKLIAMMPYPVPMMYEFDMWGLPLEPWFGDYQGNHFWWLPDRWLYYINNMNFYYKYKSFYYPKVEALLKKAYDFEYPPLDQLIQDVDLALINDHFSFGRPGAFPPYFIPVGGMHVQESNGTLPQDLENFIKDVDEFVFISFGSIIRVSLMPEHVQQRLFDAVASFKKTKFLWKWEGEVPKNMPKNALAQKWFPQQDVLAHKKCKGFVTQGGLMSLQQALYHKVPFVVVPGFGDQTYNAKLVERNGLGIYLELADITKETLSDSINKILRVPEYQKNVQETARRFKDRPMSPVDTAVWWTEYALRHDMAHLKSPAIRLSWWQRRMVDFWMAVFVLFAASTFALGYVISRVWARLAGSSSPATTKLKSS